MSKSLVIVESPAKANTINKFLGKDYTVLSSTGHIRDLPLKKIGIDEKNNFAPQYDIVPGKQKLINELKKESKKASKIFLSPDPDREGEAIAWHLFEILGGDKKKIKRVSFNEITKAAIQKAIKLPRDIDIDKVNSQQARRILDRLVGYKISPLLWEKVGKGLSAGRVQSVAVRLICEREADIESFVPQEYWTIEAELKKTKATKIFFIAQLEKIDNKKAEIKNEKQAKKICNEVKKKDFIVHDIKERTKKRNPYPPFITSTLQQAAVNKYHWSAANVMRVAQQLYEGLELGKDGHSGLITYMRTDSVSISQEAQKETAAYIKKTYGKEYAPAKPNVYKNKKSAQAAHEAIRPTQISAARSPESLKKYLTKEQYLLYKLIWSRFVASQMEKAIVATTTISILSGKYLFKCVGSKVVFPGFTVAYEEEQKEKERLPNVAKGDILFLEKLVPDQHFTIPPPRYTEASLVKILEEKEIGRPSTYAPIIQTILKREYVTKEDRKFYPTTLGKVVTEILVKSFENIINVEFTAGMEEKLDKIENGKLEWVKVLKNFYTPFIKTLKYAQKNVKSLKAATKKTTITCDLCGKKMMIRWSRNGEFLACSGYPQCKNTKEFQKNSNGKIEIIKPKETDHTCEKCGKAMIIKKGRFGEFLACSGYPECRSTKPIPTGVHCPNCEGELVRKKSARGRFFYGCSNYPECTYTTLFLKKEKKEEESEEPPAKEPLKKEKKLTVTTKRTYKKKTEEKKKTSKGKKKKKA
ncbi:type I DNA topoisomerase [Candidatus Auribacterota bacterium]